MKQLILLIAACIAINKMNAQQNLTINDSELIKLYYADSAHVANYFSSINIPVDFERVDESMYYFEYNFDGDSLLIFRTASDNYNGISYSTHNRDHFMQFYNLISSKKYIDDSLHLIPPTPEELIAKSGIKIGEAVYPFYINDYLYAFDITIEPYNKGKSKKYAFVMTSFPKG